MVQADNNAMTEVALALAMAFFTIFILAAVSMSQVVVNTNAAKSVQSHQDTFIHDLNVQFENNGDRQLLDSEILVIYYRGEFLTHELKPFQFKNNHQENQRYILGIDPSLSMADIIHIKQTKKLPNLSITLLNAEWQKRLELMK